MKTRSFQNSFQLLVCGIAFVIATGNIFAQSLPGSCGDVLLGPAYNRFKVSTGSEFDNKFSSEFCEGTHTKSKETIKADTSGSYALIFSGSFGFDEEKFFEAVRNFCSSQSGETKNASRLELLSEIVNKEIYDRWLECIRIKETSPGLKVELDYSESTDFVFKVRFNGAFNVNSALVENFIPKNADCAPLVLPVGAEIVPRWTVQPCSRNTFDGKGPGNLTINVKNPAGVHLDGTSTDFRDLRPPAPLPVTVNEFKITPPTIKSGESATLSWSVGPLASVTSVKIDGSLADAVGTRAFSTTLPDNSTTSLAVHFTLIALGKDGSNPSAKTDLTVLPLIPTNKNPVIAIQDDFTGGKMIACPKGYAIAGAHEDNNRVLCRQVIVSLNQAPNEIGTVESNNVCPAGTYMRGMFIGGGGSSSRTLCSWNRKEYPDPASVPLQFAKTSTNSLGSPSGDVDENMHACPQSDPAHFITVITAIDYRKEVILNAKPKTTAESFTCSQLRR